jgi:hypothetical protein
MTFITVRYGQNEEKLLNPNCISSVLLSYIKKNCGFEELAEPIDLCSAETGEVVDLISKPKEYAKKYLEPRGAYILLKVIGDDSEESTPTFVSLLESSNIKISTNSTKTKAKKTIKSSIFSEASKSQNTELMPKKDGFANSSRLDLSTPKPKRDQGSPKKKPSKVK